MSAAPWWNCLQWPRVRVWVVWCGGGGVGWRCVWGSICACAAVPWCLHQGGPGAAAARTAGEALGSSGRRRRRRRRVLPPRNWQPAVCLRCPAESLVPEVLKTSPSPQEFMDSLHEVGAGSGGTLMFGLVVLGWVESSEGSGSAAAAPPPPTQRHRCSRTPNPPPPNLSPRPQHDAVMEARVAEADAHGEVLRYVGSYDAESGVCQVRCGAAADVPCGAYRVPACRLLCSLSVPWGTALGRAGVSVLPDACDACVAVTLLYLRPSTMLPARTGAGAAVPQEPPVCTPVGHGEHHCLHHAAVQVGLLCLLCLLCGTAVQLS